MNSALQSRDFADLQEVSRVESVVAVQKLPNKQFSGGVCDLADYAGRQARLVAGDLLFAASDRVVSEVQPTVKHGKERKQEQRM